MARLWPWESPSATNLKTRRHRPAQQAPAGLDLIHDFGSVLEGTQVEHAFEAVNHLAVSIAIVDDTDIHKTCGCTTLETSRQRLEPGEKATIRMRVDTTGKSGRFRVGGLIRWHAEGGESWPVNLYLEGIAKKILATQPGLVRFSANDVREQKTKDVSIFNSLQVDWSTLNVQVEPPYVQVVEKSVQGDHITLSLQAQPPSGVIDFSTTLRLTANLGLAQGDVKTCSIGVPIQGSQAVDVQVSPRVVFASWSQDQRKGSARFMVWGPASDVPSTIASISCDGFRAAWKSTEVAHAKEPAYRTLQVDLDLSEPADASIDTTKARNVRIALERGQSFEVPLYIVAHQERS